MAGETDVINSIVGQFPTMAEGIYQTALYALGGLVLIGIIWYFFIYMPSFKHVFRYKQVANNRKIVHYDRFKEVKDRDGIEWYRLLKLKMKIPTAPEVAVELDHKGHKVVDAYRLATGEFIYIQDDSTVIPDELLDIRDKKKREQKIKEFIKDKKVVSSYTPLKTSHRLILINQIIKAQKRKRKALQDYIIPVVGIGALVVIVVSLMIFYGDIAKPVLQANDQMLQAKQMDLEQTKILQEISQDIQVIKDNQEEANS